MAIFTLSEGMNAPMNPMMPAQNTPCSWRPEVKANQHPAHSHRCFHSPTRAVAIPA